MANELRKVQRLLAEQKQQTEEERRLATEANEQINQLQIRVKTLKRQLEEAVSIVQIILVNKTLSKGNGLLSSTIKSPRHCMDPKIFLALAV